jgi:CHAT domain-containing protein
MPEDEQTRFTVENMRTRVEALAKARTVLLEEIRGRFPRYTDFINPEQATVDKVQGSLRANEALLVIYPAEKETYIWSVPQKGNIRLATSTLGRKDLARIVNRLCRSLAPNPTILGDIPEFDLRSAHELYNELLNPVEEGWGQAKDLLIVAPGPLGQIPFSVLPTSPVVLKEGKGALFSSYREVPWLVRKVSITSYPAVSSFLALRSLPEGDPQRKPFVGFGDPVFSKEPIVSLGIPETSLASRGGSRIQVRGIRISGTGNLDNKNITSMNLEKLHRLPDTAEEVKEIATALGAKHNVDTFIGERATEKQVNTMDLSDRRVIAFASHALLPWDLDGLDQPAIALSSPTVTGGDEDGLLTMTEIMKLRLNADWVVLSACNTGAASGEGVEAVSGLGRAFFYAGTRAALVTMWPVETTSSHKLVAGIFISQKNDQSLSRAQALRKSMLDLIDKGNLIEEPTGNIVASYAHPFFWAPFVIE